MSCSIVTVERRLTAVVKTKAAFAKIPDAQRTARAAVDGAVSSLDAGPVGRPCTVLAPAAGALDMEIGTIVARSSRPRVRSCLRTCRQAAPHIFC